MIERIPAMTMAGSRRNKDMVRLKQDLEERARINMMKETEAEGKAETMYVDVTRNVGVVLGELSVGWSWVDWVDWVGSRAPTQVCHLV